MKLPVPCFVMHLSSPIQGWQGMSGALRELARRTVCYSAEPVS